MSVVFCVCGRNLTTDGKCLDCAQYPQSCPCEWLRVL